MGASNTGGVDRNCDVEQMHGFITCCEPFQWQVDHGELTLVAGKRPCLLMAGDDKVCDKKPQHYTEDNVMQW